MKGRRAGFPKEESPTAAVQAWRHAESVSEAQSEIGSRLGVQPFHLFSYVVDLFPRHALMNGKFQNMRAKIGGGGTDFRIPHWIVPELDCLNAPSTERLRCLMLVFD